MINRKKLKVHFRKKFLEEQTSKTNFREHWHLHWAFHQPTCSFKHGDIWKAAILFTYGKQPSTTINFWDCSTLLYSSTIRLKSNSHCSLPMISEALDRPFYGKVSRRFLLKIFSILRVYQTEWPWTLDSSIFSGVELYTGLTHVASLISKHQAPWKYMKLERFDITVFINCI